ncbi:MAG TPA: glycosyltransferase family 4 protein, partial [Candidatus Nanoarchaeia archaeon]|nr:glycosyltransferase family 4 protein [Candidatus Nanoarchaeia archaeon]
VANRLCIVTHTFLPHVGGIERVVYEQSKRLMKKNFSVEVLTHRNYTPRHYTYDGISVRCYDALNIGFRLGIPYPIPNVTSIDTFLKAIKSTDLVHAHGHPYLSSLAAAKLAKRYGKPFLLTQHNTFINYDGVWDMVEKVNDAAVGKQTIKEARHIIVISKATQNYVLRLGADPQKVSVIYNGVDLSRFKLMPDAKTKVRRKLSIPNDAIVALTVRRLVYKNGIDTLIESARIAIVENPKIVYLVVGKGPDFEDVKSKINRLGIEKNFVLAGFVSDEELPNYYNAADFFVLPSKSGEGLPLVALEAMACGLSLVATDVGGVREIMINGFGNIVPPNDPTALANAVVQFSNINADSLRLKLRQIITEKYSWDSNVEQLLKVYQEII